MRTWIQVDGELIETTAHDTGAPKNSDGAEEIIQERCPECNQLLPICSCNDW